MRRPEKRRILRISTVGGFVCSFVVLLSALVIYAVWTPSRFGWLAAIVLGAGALSLPFWTGGLVYGLSTPTGALPDGYTRPLFCFALAAMGSFLLGQALVLGSLRLLGDLSYVVGAVLLLCVTGTVLSLTAGNEGDTAGSRTTR